MGFMTPVQCIYRSVRQGWTLIRLGCIAGMLYYGQYITELGPILEGMRTPAPHCFKKPAAPTGPILTSSLSFSGYLKPGSSQNKVNDLIITSGVSCYNDREIRRFADTDE